MVTIMDNDERQAILDKARANVDRLRDLKVEHRAYDDDVLMRWRAGMPRPAPPPTMAEIEQRIADAMADIDSRIAAAFEARAWEHEATLEAIGMAFAEERKHGRGELAAGIEKLKSEFDLRLSALLQATEKLERGIGGDRGTVIDLPAILPRDRRA